MIPLVGCNAFGNNKLVQELQHENDRLLTEFRAERQRREDSERSLQIAQRRLAESEKLLAQGYRAPTRSRLSQRQTGPTGTAATSTSFSSELPGATTSQDGDSELKWQRRVSR